MLRPLTYCYSCLARPLLVPYSPLTHLFLVPYLPLTHSFLLPNLTFYQVVLFLVPCFTPYLLMPYLSFSFPYLSRIYPLLPLTGPSLTRYSSLARLLVAPYSTLTRPLLIPYLPPLPVHHSSLTHHLLIPYSPPPCPLLVPCLPVTLPLLIPYPSLTRPPFLVHHWSLAHNLLIPYSPLAYPLLIPHSSLAYPFSCPFSRPLLNHTHLLLVLPGTRPYLVLSSSPLLPFLSAVPRHHHRYCCHQRTRCTSPGSASPTSNFSRNTPKYQT